MRKRVSSGNGDADSGDVLHAKDALSWAAHLDALGIQAHGNGRRRMQRIGDYLHSGMDRDDARARRLEAKRDASRLDAADDGVDARWQLDV